MSFSKKYKDDIDGYRLGETIHLSNLSKSSVCDGGKSTEVVGERPDKKDVVPSTPTFLCISSFSRLHSRHYCGIIRPNETLGSNEYCSH